MQTLRYVFQDGSEKTVSIPDPGKKLVIEAKTLPANLKYVDVMPDFLTAKTGDAGSMIIPCVEGAHHAAQTFFRERPDAEEVFPDSSMPIFGLCRKNDAVLAIVTGMQFEYSLVLGVKAGKYYLYTRFLLDGDAAYENIEIELVTLTGKDACYQGMARYYRKFQLDHKKCRLLRDRVKENEVLKEFAEGIEVRVRLAWKPVPSTIDDQTVENEPPVHAELTFQRLGDIIDEFHRQGIEHANFCIVGWNVGGHDGRFPDLFPVEPACGTLEEFKAVIAKAKSYGYLITCHTNLIEGYSIGKRFDLENTLMQKDGTPMRGGNWGGGKSYWLCPEQAYKKYLSDDLKALKDLGCRGEHYFDVFSILPPYACHNPHHPLNRKQVAEWRCKILDAAREAIGVSGSEGSWDFCCDSLDYVLYAAFFLHELEKPHPMVDKYIPLWFIVYHGIQLYNCFAAGVNANLKRDKQIRLWNYAWGARPLSYVNSRFKKGVNPWGQEDLRYESEEQFARDVMTIKLDYDKYREIRDLQFLAIVDYDEPAENIFVTTYEDGRKMFTNLRDKSFILNGMELDAYSFLVK